MRSAALVVLAGLLAGPGMASAGVFPPDLTYHIFVRGRYAGKSVIKVEERGGKIVFRSSSDVNFEDYWQKLECRTEVDRATLAPRRFSYEGTKVGIDVSGTVRVEGDSILADLVQDGVRFPSARPFSGPLQLFQNYVVEHQVLILAATARATEPFFRFQLLFPSDFALASVVATLESEVEVQTSPKPTACRKYQIGIQSSVPFVGLFDPARNVPIYLDYPGSDTEIFLEAAYGERPKTKYQRAASSR